MSSSSPASKTSAAEARRRWAWALLAALGVAVSDLGPRPVPAPNQPVAARPPLPVGLSVEPSQPVDLNRDFPAEPDSAPWPGGDAVADYLHDSRYPPDSRPLTRHQRHRIEWNRRFETPRALDDATWWLLTADRAFVLGDEPLAVELTVGDGRPAIAVEGAWVRVGAEERPLSLQPTADGWAAVVRPGGFAGQTSRPVRIEVALSTPAGPVRGLLHALHVPHAALPARFTGDFADALVDGSLRIDVGIDVIRPGRYLIDANLHDEAGEPVAWARYKAELPAGVGTAPLRFFGKVLVDGGRPGPWRLGELRGQLHTPGAQPDLEPMEPWGTPWFTQAWALSELSAAEWASPRRAARLAALERLPLAPPRPTGAPAH